MNEITPAELAARGVVTVIDVRETDEYELGHVPGAKLIPLGELAARTSEIPTSGPVYIVCHSGMRSARATEFLAADGIDAVNVVGGTAAWQQVGLPTTRGAAA
ncbi:rhodanese-related sulfurtransferase [Glaciihabitans tibetensis]|uniref:Rhodanese-related sulfurtransferase n=1 Tax=Glaciihabitans tibetensis TaxID=1266600 RepID=A0A2T0VK63_9MICO|nr:rhodanese-like domain-containing protein [Glaciihabitans tibetensis]PRY70617.1 rhodanese-related sulfurtransferase [Glaciihabitans tibetensis]